MAVVDDRRASRRQFGRYEVLRVIGRGGMGEVSLARVVGPGGVEKRVCLKHIRSDLIIDPRASERFLAETRLALGLQHANIVPVFDFGRHDQELFLVMEWIDGCDLGRLMPQLHAAGDRVTPLLVAYVGCEVSKALGYAHEHTNAAGTAGGLVHRDVTPRNILVSRRGEIRLTDFGIARALGAIAASSGTPRYMSPEQAEGQPPNPTDDLFSLGLVLGEMLSGSPLRAGSPSTAGSRPPNLPSDLPAAFAEVRVIVEKMIAPELPARFKVAADVERAFSTVLAAATLRGEAPPVAELAGLVAAAAPVAVGATEPISAAPLTMAPPTVDESSLPARRRAPAFFARRGAWAIAALLVAATVLGGLVFRAARTAPLVSETPAPVSRLAAPVAPATATGRKETPATPATMTADAPAPRSPIVSAARPRGETGRPLAQLRITAPGSWVAVYLDGKKLGDDAGSFAIPAGRHLLRVENPPLGFVSSEIINIRPGEEVGRTYAPTPRDR